jgi:hypothetical protein
MQLENLKILKMQSNKSEKLQSLLWRYRFGWDLNPRPRDSLVYFQDLAILVFDLGVLESKKHRDSIA